MWVPESAMAVGVAPAGGARRPKAIAASSGGAGGGTGAIAVPMQGTIVKVLVAVGEKVEIGQAVCILEAMKMENHVNTDVAGEVKEIRVEPGQAVGAGDVVVVIA
jgi:acetyl-CoA/propionyl-CoA carboxylase biotin carboxyl carrier protein